MSDLEKLLRCHCPTKAVHYIPLRGKARFRDELARLSQIITAGPCIDCPSCHYRALPGEEWGGLKNQYCITN